MSGTGEPDAPSTSIGELRSINRSIWGGIAAKGTGHPKIRTFYEAEALLNNEY